LPSKISGSIADGDLARLYATIYVRVASGFENKKAPKPAGLGCGGESEF
jgi:hypothetical protein